MSKVAPTPTPAPVNGALQDLVTQTLARAELSPEQAKAAIDEARTLAGQRLSVDEADSFAKLRDGLEARGVLKSDQVDSINAQLASEGLLRGAYVDAAMKAGKKNAVVAGVVGVLLSAATLAGFASAPAATDAAGLFAAANFTVNILTLMSCRAFVGGAELSAGRYGQNAHEAKIEPKLQNLS